MGTLPSKPILAHEGDRRDAARRLRPAVAAVHPGRILQCFDHFVADLRTGGRAAAYFTVYAVEYAPDLGTGHVAFLRVRFDDQARADLDVTFTDAPDMARRMQARLRGLVSSRDVSRGIGTSLDQAPIVAQFERLPWTSEGVGWVVRATASDGPTVEAHWLQPEPPIWTAAMAGTFTGERDILGMLAGFSAASVRVDGVPAPGEPWLDPWWERRLGRPFSSTHVALAEASLTPAGSAWWDGLQG